MAEQFRPDDEREDPISEIENHLNWIHEELQEANRLKRLELEIQISKEIGVTDLEWFGDLLAEVRLDGRPKPVVATKEAQ